jgi:hypothetical protein
MTTQTGAGVTQAAFEDAGLCSIGQTISAAQQARGLDRLNDIINLWATQGLKLWLQRDIPIPLSPSQGTYRLSPSGDVVMTKPLQVIQAYYETTDGIRQPLVPLSRDEYTRLSQVNVEGGISSYFVDKQQAYFDISFWNTPSTSIALGTGHVIARVSAPNLTVAADNVTFPPEWTIALRWALADEIATGQSQEIQNRATLRAAAYRSDLEAFDVEDAPTFFRPDTRTGYGSSSFR